MNTDRGNDKKIRQTNIKSILRPVHRYVLHRIFYADDAEFMEVH